MKLLGKYNNVIKNIFFIFCFAIVAFISYYEFIYKTSFNDFFALDSEAINKIFITYNNLENNHKSEMTYTDQNEIKSFLQSVNDSKLKRKVVKEQLLRMGLPISHNGSSNSNEILSIFIDDVKGNHTFITVYFGKSMSISVLNTNNQTVKRYEFELIGD